jgi:hypothetical protein
VARKAAGVRWWKRIWRLFFGLFRAAVWIAGLATLLVLALLAFSEQPLPRPVQNWLFDRLSGGGLGVDARGAAFGLRGGLVLRHVRLLPKRVTDPAWLTAEELRLSGRMRPGQPPAEWLEAVVVHRLAVSALPPDGLLAAATNATAAPAPLALPDAKFDVVDASFLGMRFSRLQGRMRQDGGEMAIENVHVVWPSDRWQEEADGRVRFHPLTGRVEGEIAGRTVPERIYPLFRLLRARDLEELCRRFEFPSGPVDVKTTFLYEPATPRCEVRVTLAGRDLRYNGVPVTRAAAVIEAEGSNGLDRVAVRDLVCERPDGTLAGALLYDVNRTNLDVQAKSDLPLAPLGRLIGLFTNGPGPDVLFPAPPRLTVHGRVALEGSADHTLVSGTFAAATATLRRLPVQALQGAFAYRTNTLAFRNVSATVDGGQVTADFEAELLAGATATPFRTSVRLRDVDMAVLGAALGYTNPPPGKASGEANLSGTLGAAFGPSLSGHGRVDLQGGVVSRVPLFAGFTDYLARNVPGVEKIVDQSEVRLPFAITNGLLRSDRALVEGTVFSLAGRGTYDIPQDRLRFDVQASIFKRRTFLGKLTQLVSLPFARLLLEFRVSGTATQPDWEYRGILERIVDTVGGVMGERKDAVP